MGAEHKPASAAEPSPVAGANVAQRADDAVAQVAARSHDWLSAVVDASEEGIVSFGLDLGVRSWNAGAERIFGYSAADCVGQPLTMMAPGEEDQQHRNMRRLERGERLRFHATRLRKDGREVLVAMDVMPVRDGGGNVVGGMAVVHDITEARLAHEALQRSEAMLTDALRELADANEAKDRFIATLSHELRNPLASIASSVEVLADAGAAAGLRQHALEIVRRQTGTVRHLLDDLLDVARLRLGRLSLRLGPTTLAEVAGMAEETLGPAIQARSHRFEVDLPPADIALHGDKVRLAQVLCNLLANAAKYTPPGGHIRLSAEVEGDTVRVAVQDDGPGLDASELESVFGLFVQANHDGEATAAGLGIGLALARNIAQLHGGTLHAESAGRGHGCRFVATLPIVVAGARDVAEGTAPPAPATSTGTLLLVDDNPDALWGLRMVLERFGYKVLTAGSAEEAFGLAEHVRPAALLLDISLPGVSGLDLARQVRATAWGRSAVLIALTGMGQDHDLRRSLEAGFDAHLTKPADVGELRRLLARLQHTPGK